MQKSGPGVNQVNGDLCKIYKKWKYKWVKAVKKEFTPRQSLYNIGKNKKFSKGIKRNVKGLEIVGIHLRFLLEDHLSKM